MNNKPISEVIADIETKIQALKDVSHTRRALVTTDHSVALNEYELAIVPENITRLLDHIAALEQQNARLQFIVESADKVQKEFADELGCAGDNESILEAIDALKQQLAAERERVVNVESEQTTEIGQQILIEAIGAHGYIVGCLTQGRPDLALAESRKWVEAFSQAGSIIPVEGE
ncbi:hypothetical protein ACFFL1_05955 [Samsonia erythrinae]|uniref:Ead/Ea22-like family protein n=1 Tax=Samsonia erythrinae TaxID=160434 RepID=A0A4R3VFI3_9GAMM|nr:hypothetical protein [Samsonia erythrinae]TCV04176.1 hypothetical protein EDC54_11146 [Samsonia erythrinae]